jgi:hypothetical protein
MIVHRLRTQSGDYLITVEVVIHSILGILLAATGLLTLAGAGKLLFEGIAGWSMASGTFDVGTGAVGRPASSPGIFDHLAMPQQSDTGIDRRGLTGLEQRPWP